MPELARHALSRSPFAAQVMQAVSAQVFAPCPLPVSLPLLEGLLLSAVAIRQASTLMILPCGQILPLLDEMHLLDERVSRLKMQVHISLSLNEFILPFVSQIPQAAFGSICDLSSAELELVRQARSGQFKEIKVEFNAQGQPTAIESLQVKTIGPEDEPRLLKQRKAYHRLTFKHNYHHQEYLERVQRKKFPR
jgi:hypothetical protein